MRISFVDLQASIIFGLDAKKRVRHIYYRVPVAVVFSGVKYDPFSIENDEDLQVLFHCLQQYPEVRITELYAEIKDMWASSGESTPHSHPVHAGASDVPLPARSLVMENQDNDDAYDLGDNRSFGELVLAMSETPQPPSPRTCHADPDPMVEEALKANDSDEEPALIDGHSDDDRGPFLWLRRGRRAPGHSNTLLTSPH
ncbi:hypothetical protein PIB30_027567 [Stylosanthes scabra]|uniref:Uncharacterized protein n=1 Tax=Stylosanthes scabra TaxID=79078 RepID=A0ABU6W8P5_9FABA|nr:hypothetical protein [Stylosanthes scabra]